MRLDTEKFAFDAPVQKEMILSEVAGNLPKIRLSRNRILVATYVEPKKTSGGILLAPKTLDESRFQGKVGLVLALGPMAFKYEDPAEYQTEAPKVGDWIFYRASDTFETGFSGVFSRIVYDDNVIGIVEDPTIIY